MFEYFFGPIWVTWYATRGVFSWLFGGGAMTVLDRALELAFAIWFSLVRFVLEQVFEWSSLALGLAFETFYNVLPVEAQVALSNVAAVINAPWFIKIVQFVYALLDGFTVGPVVLALFFAWMIVTPAFWGIRLATILISRFWGSSG